MSAIVATPNGSGVSIAWHLVLFFLKILVDDVIWLDILLTFKIFFLDFANLPMNAVSGATHHFWTHSKSQIFYRGNGLIF